MKKGTLIILSGPSGVGKGTIREELFKDESLNLCYSISMTTRNPRPLEKDGVDYFFVDVDTFKDKIEKGELLEDVLDVQVKVGNRSFDLYSNAEQYVFMSNNAISGDVVITIKNTRVDEEKDSSFALGGLSFNVFDQEEWIPEVEEETEVPEEE